MGRPLPFRTSRMFSFVMPLQLKTIPHARLTIADEVVLHTATLASLPP
jgi:hypothetical protein